MKTNQIMIRDNKAFVQRTKDGYFNANSLLNKWNETEYNSLQLGGYKVNKSTIDFVEQLKSEGIEKPMISSRGINGGTWMHPKLFIDFAMWVSTEFKSIVIDYVLDGLINSRHEAGDYYNEMCAEILNSHLKFYGTKPNPKLYIEEARRIKSILGVSKVDRNDMSENQLKSITQLQNLNTMLLSDGVGVVSRIKQLKQQARLLSRSKK